MGIFADGKTQEVLRDLEKSLAPSDGKIHTLVLVSFGKFASSQTFSIDKKASSEIDQVVSAMQQMNCEIIDIKFSSQLGGGVTGQGIAYHTLIMYK